MKVCIVAEGCYPYVVGGVSGWINSMIKSFPNIEFILLTIVANRSVRGKFVYELPENLTQVYELYLEDCEWEARTLFRVEPGDTLLILGDEKTGIIVTKPDVIRDAATQVFENLRKNEARENEDQ